MSLEHTTHNTMDYHGMLYSSCKAARLPFAHLFPPLTQPPRHPLGRVFFYLNLKAWGDINRILGHDDIADTYALKAAAAGTNGYHNE